MIVLASLAAQAGQALPEGPTALDRGFAYGAVLLLIALIWWNGRSSKDPPRS